MPAGTGDARVGWREVDFPGMEEPFPAFPRLSPRMESRCAERPDIGYLPVIQFGLDFAQGNAERSPGCSVFAPEPRANPVGHTLTVSKLLLRC